MSISDKSGQGGSTSGSGTSTPTQQITQYLSELRNPTDFMVVWNQFVQRAGQVGVTQQQLLDSISDNYRSK